MDIDPRIIFGTAATVITGSAAAFIGFIRRLDSKVSRDEMHDNLERRDTRVQENLDRVLEALDRQNERSAEYRKLTADQFQKLSEDIAVLKDRAGRRRENYQA